MNCRLLELPRGFEGELYLSAAEYVSSSLAEFDIVVTILELTRVLCRNVKSGALLKRVLDPSHTLLDFACTQYEKTQCARNYRFNKISSP